jgi:hypothetical protein
MSAAHAFQFGVATEPPPSLAVKAGQGLVFEVLYLGQAAIQINSTTALSNRAKADIATEAAIVTTRAFACC